METRIGDDAVIRSHTVIYAGNIIGEGALAGAGSVFVDIDPDTYNIAPV